jgi:sugar phosphate isomerase/epimerase
MQLGIFAKTYNRRTVEQTLQAVRNDGLSAVQFNMSVLGLPTIPDPIGPQAIAEIAQAADAARVTLAAISGTFNAAHPDPDTRVPTWTAFLTWPRLPPRSRSRSSP